MRHWPTRGGTALARPAAENPNNSTEAPGLPSGVWLPSIHFSRPASRSQAITLLAYPVTSCTAASSHTVSWAVTMSRT